MATNDLEDLPDREVVALLCYIVNLSKRDDFQDEHADAREIAECSFQDADAFINEMIKQRNNKQGPHG